MKTYGPTSDEVQRCLDKMRKRYHPDLEGVTIGAIFVFDEEESSKRVLKHNGYPAAAVVRITSMRDRALGMQDAVIVIDRAHWMDVKGAVAEALIDHELQHLERVIDPDKPKPEQKRVDSLGRPMLTMRRHDRQFGWFDEVAQRHGPNSLEVMQAASLMASARQLYFDFPDKAA